MKRTFAHALLLWAALVALATAINAAGPVPTSSLRWAEGLLHRSSSPPTSWLYDPMTRVCLRDAEYAFWRIVTNYDPSARACAGLARCQELQGKYEKAVRSFELAGPLGPSTHKELEEARLCVRLKSVASAQLPEEHTVLRVLRCPDQANHWLVLSSRLQKDDQNWPTYSDVRLTLFKGELELPRKLWQSAALGFPGNSDGRFNDLQAYILDLNGDGVQEVVIPEVAQGAWWSPSHIDIFAFRDGRMEKLLGASAYFPVDLRDLNNDGSYEVIVKTAYVGWGLATAEMPVWFDIYAYKDGYYQLADWRFPRQYDEPCRKMRAALAKHPRDYGLLKYYGAALRFRGRPRAALRAYRQAERELATTLDQADTAETRRLLSRDMADIRRRIQSIMRD